MVAYKGQVLAGVLTKQHTMPKNASGGFMDVSRRSLLTFSGITGAVVGLVGTSTLASASTGETAPSLFVGIDPFRAYDSRDDAALGGARPGGGKGYRLNLHSDVANVKRVPDSATALQCNFTVANTTAAGFLSILPGNATQKPSVSTMNWDHVNEVVANSTTVKPVNGEVIAYIHSYTHVIIDVVGYFTPA